MPWDPKGMRVRLAVWWAIAAGWFALGVNSDRVPFGNEAFWIIACGAVAGTAIGFATRRTVASLNVYLLSATFLGLVRSLAYLNNNSGGPAAVWFIIAMTNLIIYLGQEEWRYPNARS